MLQAPVDEALYLASARALREVGVGGPSWAVGLRPRLGKAADGLVLALARATGRRTPSPPRSDRLPGTAHSHSSVWHHSVWARSADDADDADGRAAALFPLPDPPRIVSVEQQRLPGGVIEDLRFPCYEGARRPTALELLRRYPENATAYARRYGHDAPGHPAVICLHGWRGGRYSLEATIFGAQRLYALGFDVYLYVHPYHGPRRPLGVPPSVSLHPSASISRTNEALLQTVWEVRALLRHHRAERGADGGVIGISLGAYAAAVLASVAEELRFVVPILPIADLTALLWSLAPPGPGPAEDGPALDFDAHCRLMAVHAPLAHRLVLPREEVLLIAGRTDRVVPPTHAEALWEHWGRPALHWFPGGHLLHFGRADYRDALEQFLLARNLPQLARPTTSSARV
ncbi:MAG: hypothetical protein IPG96_19780 [Proteobacteria bacterium]|nr:hypothetical protein [Pseudomonadota bacterium]